MPAWQITHGIVRGAYLRTSGGNELYVRHAGERGSAGGAWLWYLDGTLMGAERNELTARAAAETAGRVMVGTHTARMAAPAG